MHWKYGGPPLTENWVMTQRPACASNFTIGSPSLFVPQLPADTPLQIALPGVGPASSAPVVLSNTAKSRLTHSTTCVAPTDAFVSGGAQQSRYVPRPTPTPS